MEPDRRLAVGQQPRRAPQHDHDHREAEEEHPVLLEVAEDLRQADQDEGRDDDAELAAEAAQDDEG